MSSGVPTLKFGSPDLWKMYVLYTFWLQKPYCPSLIKITFPREYYGLVKKFTKSRHTNRCIRARLHEIRSELKPVWNLKTLWNVFLFTWQFTWRFQSGSFLNNRKALLHLCRWYLLINVNLLNATSVINDSF